MTDIASAIKMEEEALQRMKKQSLQKSVPTTHSSSMKGISNPNCQFSFKSSSKVSSSIKKEAVPDLMSFQEVSSGNQDDSTWTSFNDQSHLDTMKTRSGSTKSAYDKSINDHVLSLYNVPTAHMQMHSSQQQSFYQPPGTLAYNWPNDPTFNRNKMFLPQAHHGYNSGLHLDLSNFSHQYSGGNSFTPIQAVTQMNVNSSLNNSNLVAKKDCQIDSFSNARNPSFPRPSSLGQLEKMNVETSALTNSPTNPRIHNQPRLHGDETTHVVGSMEGVSRSSMIGFKEQVDSSEPPQDERLTSIFDEWLNGGWTSGSATASPRHEPPSQVAKNEENTPNWLEWDPLNNSQPLEKVDFNTQQQTVAKLSRSQSNRSTSVKDEPFFSENQDISSSVELDDLSEFELFARALSQLRSSFVFEDTIANPGHVISPMSTCHRWSEPCEGDSNDGKTAVRIVVTADGIEEPVTFECDVNASVEHIISQALCIAFEDISCVSIEDFFFKVAGRQEYLISKTRLGLYQYVQECRKFEQDIRLELLHKSKVDRSLQRTVDDDAKVTIVEDFLNLLPKPIGVVSRADIQVLLESFYKETEKLLDATKQEVELSLLQQHYDRVVQTVKALCSALANVEVGEISDSIKQLNSLMGRPFSTPGIANRSMGSDASLSDGWNTLALSVKLEKLREGLEVLTSALLDYIQLYCKAHQINAFFRSSTNTGAGRIMPTTSSLTVRELFSVKVISLHRIPKQWETSFGEFYVSCAIWHANRQLSNSKSCSELVKVTKNFYPDVCWNNWIEFDVAVCELPLEAQLRILLIGVQRADDKVSEKSLAWLNLPLFDSKSIMRHKSGIFGMWDFSKYSKSGRLVGPLDCNHDILTPESVVLYLAFSKENIVSSVVRHSIEKSNDTSTEKSVQWKSIESMDRKVRAKFDTTVARARLTAGPLFNLSQRERDFLWQNRLVTSSDNDTAPLPVLSLPILLQCVPSWSPTLSHLQSAHELLAAWPKPLEPEESLELLTFTYPDSHVRSAAIKWLEQAEDTEISSWLPQLVQALRCEPYHDSQLSRLLLRRALGNVRICHQLYWLLDDNMWGSSFRQRYTALHAALTTICGAAMKKEFKKESFFIRKINKTAEDVKQAKESMKTSVLLNALERVASLVNGSKFRIPTNPALVTTGVAVKNSSYFSSNAVPLKLSFINADSPNSDIFIMYKVGDDLRQDALTMQLIRVMDRMWLCEGLDLRIVTFDCLPTGHNKGMVEIVPDSKTFREIQSSYGLTGAFKDRPIAEWLQKYNPTGLSYERAVENFTLSCAGYCVATYVLGICDRHNDNIMLRSSGHLFHIDFARFLGHAQMFGNIKRDRAPFVLTSDMAYVINGGDRPSSKFQDFVDVCCLAFNILRKQAHTIINLLSLMLNCGIPELSSKADLKYVYDTLKPNASDTEATTMFTRLIESSLSSSFTRINFFIHNLAQMRFHGTESEEDKKTLSFSPQIHGYKEEEGMISSAAVVEYQKRYDPEKYYLYCVKVTRERNSSSIDSYVFRTFDEFEELHRKLSYNSHLQLPNFPNSVVVGRSQVKQVAEKRKEKLNSYLRQLLTSNRNVAMHDLVYTFFHPILRDEERDKSPAVKSPGVAVGGEIKFSLHYKNNALYVMIHHCKNLSPVNGTDPDPYVKTYLLPDPFHTTKRKTKVARKTLHPTYNEMLVYRMPLSDVKLRQLCVGVWNYENFQENDFMGKVVIDLSTFDLSVDSSKWYLLEPGSI